MLVLWDLSSLDDIRAFPHEARMSPTIRRFVAADVLPVNYTYGAQIIRPVSQDVAGQD